MKGEGRFDIPTTYKNGKEDTNELHIHINTRWWKVCGHVNYDLIGRIGFLDRWIMSFFDKTYGRLSLYSVCWAHRDGDANISSTCVERGARHVGKKGRTLIAIWFLLTHTHTHIRAYSLTFLLSFFSHFALYLFRFSFHIFSRHLLHAFTRSLARSLSLSLTLSYNTRKMQRITIFFLSPFVHNVESIFRGSFSIFTRAV